MRPYTSENAQLQPLLIIECRGLEFTGFEYKVRISSVYESPNRNMHPIQGPWKCVGSKGTVFTDIDLAEGEWFDYDEKVSLDAIRKGFVHRCQGCPPCRHIGS